ncbi:phosphopantetheine-binding protein [Spongiactinospora gelatinilytica]|uniref:phosphopantetheine-binding protein n=1 Tax=Spongiactinospora gelatinilytica TaxID=2666298 RepID=UPI0018F3BD78|nr:phosphopantetheine-binding protein [Spongiactinospora gelatinilytica]
MSLTPERVREDVAEVLSAPAADIPEEENLLDRGLDSIRVMTLVERWRAAGVETTFVELAEQPTLSDWYRLVGERQEQAR